MWSIADLSVGIFMSIVSIGDVQSDIGLMHSELKPQRTAMGFNSTQGVRQVHWEAQGFVVGNKWQQYLACLSRCVRQGFDTCLGATRTELRGPLKFAFSPCLPAWDSAYSCWTWHCFARPRLLPSTPLPMAACLSMKDFGQ